jgi:hypothetical protein
MDETTARGLLEDAKRLLASARDDYEKKHWNNHSYYVTQFNNLLKKANQLDLGVELQRINEAEKDDVEHTSWSSGTPYNPRMISSVGAKTKKLREVIDAVDKLFKEISFVVTIETDEPDALQVVQRICSRFHTVARQMRQRHGERPTIDISDEYDVQDLMHSLLRIFFDDIREEEYSPSYAGGASRIDFLVKQEQVIIETKKTRTNLKANQIGEELIIDIARYQTHPDCKLLYCFVYDPDGYIKNPQGIENDLSRSDGPFAVKVFIAPKTH